MSTVTASTARLTPADLVRGIWNRDAALWTRDVAGQREVANRLGWLDAPARLRPEATELVWFARRIKAAGFTKAFLLGMGGSSLAPEVFRRVFGPSKLGIDVEVLDTTDPAAIRAAEAGTDLEHTLFIVSSKSGGTVEVESLYRHFNLRIGRHGDRFIAITDPGTALDRMAGDLGFRKIFRNPPDLGGRYSVFSYFGMVPAALLGLDVGRILDQAIHLRRQCLPDAPVAANPGLQLGIALAGAADAGRDKLTLVLDWRLAAFGLWVEQLIAESLGKNGRGILPVAGEVPLGPVASYGADRMVAATSLGADWDDGTRAWLAAMERAGHPVDRRHLDAPIELGAEFYRWEFATAVAGALLEVNAFDQPDVQDAKTRTAALLGRLDRGEPLPEIPAASDADVRALLGSLQRGRQSLSVLAYLPFDPAIEAAAGALRVAIRDRHGVATAFGYGPRYLHSTGQCHKGGPGTEAFLVLTADHADDLPVPDRSYTFGQLERAQALGDLEALTARGRRALRVHLPGADAASVAAWVARILG